VTSYALPTSVKIDYSRLDGQFSTPETPPDATQDNIGHLNMEQT